MTSPKPQKTPLPGWVKSLLFLAGAVLIGAGIFSILDQAYTARWLRYADKLREGGVPLTFEEIEAQRTVIPDELNGALLLEELKEQLENIGENRWNTNRFVPFFGNKGERIGFCNAVPIHIVEPSRSFIEEHRDLFNELERLSEMPGGRFDMDLNLPALKMIIPELPSLRTASKLLYLDGSIKLVDGDITGALATFELQTHVGATLDQHPTLIGRLVQMSVDSLALESLQDILCVSELGDVHLHKLISLLEWRQRSRTVKWAFLGERAHWVSVCNEIADSKISLSKVASGAGVLPALNWMPEMLIRTNQMRGAEMLTWLIEAGDDPIALRDAFNRFDKEARSLSMTQALITIFMPSFSLAVTQHLRSVAEWGCARTALSAERFRMATGRFPEALDELIPDYLDAVPIDPFDGQPLRLVATAQGIVIYSVSENEYDDGGEVTSINKKSRPPDEGFRLLSPEHRGLLLTDDPPPDEDD